MRVYAAPGAACAPASKIRGSSNYPTAVSYLFHLRGCLQHAGHYFYRAGNTDPPSIVRILLRVLYHPCTRTPRPGDASLSLSLSLSLSRLFKTRTRSRSVAALLFFSFLFFRFAWTNISHIYLWKSLTIRSSTLAADVIIPPSNALNRIYQFELLDGGLVIPYGRDDRGGVQGQLQSVYTLLVLNKVRLLCCYGNNARRDEAEKQRAERAKSHCNALPFKSVLGQFYF